MKPHGSKEVVFGTGSRSAARVRRVARTAGSTVMQTVDALTMPSHAKRSGAEARLAREAARAINIRKFSKHWTDKQDEQYGDKSDTYKVELKTPNAAPFNVHATGEVVDETRSHWNINIESEAGVKTEFEIQDYGKAIDGSSRQVMSVIDPVKQSAHGLNEYNDAERGEIVASAKMALDLLVEADQRGEQVMQVPESPVLGLNPKAG